MAKKVTAFVRFQLNAQEANPGQKVGSALGPHGVNPMGFCKDFNAQTQSLEKGAQLTVVVTVYSDKSFTFTLSQPTVTYLLKKATGVTKGSSVPHTQKVGSVSHSALRELARQKASDLTAATLDGAVRTLAGSARSAGIQVGTEET